jgi:hypothetical protein
MPSSPIHPVLLGNRASLGLALPVQLAPPEQIGGVMLETLIVLLVLFWLLGMISSYTVGGLIHVLLVVALVVLVIRVLQGRRVV